MQQMPSDTRPRRARHEPGEERTFVTDGTRTVVRQIGWHGESGAFYGLDEDPSPYEPGSFGPMWIIAHSDRLASADALTAVLPADVVDAADKFHQVRITPPVAGWAADLTDAGWSLGMTLYRHLYGDGAPVSMV